MAEECNNTEVVLAAKAVRFGLICHNRQSSDQEWSVLLAGIKNIVCRCSQGRGISAKKLLYH